MMLSKEQILAVSDLKTEEVSVPEWGGSVVVRMMTGADRDSFESSMVTVNADGTRSPNMVNMRAKLVALTMVGEDGNLLFSVDEIGHLAGKSAAALERVFNVAQRLNGMGVGSVDDAAKNSEPGLSESSTSA